MSSFKDEALYRNCILILLMLSVQLMTFYVVTAWLTDWMKFIIVTCSWKCAYTPQLKNRPIVFTLGECSWAMKLIKTITRCVICWYLVTTKPFRVWPRSEVFVLWTLLVFSSKCIVTKLFHNKNIWTLLLFSCKCIVTKLFHNKYILHSSSTPSCPCSSQTVYYYLDLGLGLIISG